MRAASAAACRGARRSWTRRGACRRGRRSTSAAALRSAKPVREDLRPERSADQFKVTGSQLLPRLSHRNRIHSEFLFATDWGGFVYWQSYMADCEARKKKRSCWAFPSPPVTTLNGNPTDFWLIWHVGKHKPLLYFLCEQGTEKTLKWPENIYSKISIPRARRVKTLQTQRSEATHGHQLFWIEVVFLLGLSFVVIFLILLLLSAEMATQTQEDFQQSDKFKYPLKTALARCFDGKLSNFCASSAK